MVPRNEAVVAAELFCSALVWIRRENAAISPTYFVVRCPLRSLKWLDNLEITRHKEISILYETRYTNDITRYVPTVTRNLSRNALRELGNALH